METKIIIAGLAALVIGFGGGYFTAPQQEPQAHMMPDGSAMSDTMGGMMSGLEGKTGDAFDKAFIEEMIVHHEGAVAMAEALLRNTERPELQQLGNDIISAQTREIEMMRSWHASWYPQN